MENLVLGFLSHSSARAAKAGGDCLDSRESRRLEELDTEDKKRRFRAGRVLLKTMISQWTELPLRDIAFQIGENGKPSLDIDGLYFNLSHSRDLSVCVLSNKRIGIDLEFRRSGRDFAAIAEAYFSKREIQIIKTAKEEQSISAEFYRLWTLKEAYIKESGRKVWEIGIIPELYSCSYRRELPANAVHFHLPGNYALSLFAPDGISPEEITQSREFPLSGSLLPKDCLAGRYVFQITGGRT